VKIAWRKYLNYWEEERLNNASFHRYQEKNDDIIQNVIFVLQWPICPCLFCVKLSRLLVRLIKLLGICILWKQNNFTWTTDGRGCKNIPEAVNKLALSARLGHSCETGWHKHDSFYYSKQNSVLSQSKKASLLTASGMFLHPLPSVFVSLFKPLCGIFKLFILFMQFCPYTYFLSLCYSSNKWLLIPYLL
jgi:hypothetical protein